jgi:Leucine-rich repeat (LRR) protein
LEYNQISEVPPDIFEMPSIEWLRLEHNNIDAISESFVEMDKYLKLSILEGNPLTSISDYLREILVAIERAR